MDEKTQEKTEGEGVEEGKTPKTIQGEDKSADGHKTTPLIDIANAAAERMEKANSETARLLDRQEQMDARRALGGRSEAGGEPEQKEFTEEEKASRKRIKAVADASGSSWGKKYE